MFYKELYAELGRLFYHIASADGKVQTAEREKLLELIKTKWEPVETSVDEFGTDMANIIAFSFDFEEAGSETRNGFDSFEIFYKNEKENFTPALINNILQTCREIALAYRGKNREEQKVIGQLEDLLGRK